MDQKLHNFIQTTFAFILGILQVVSILVYAESEGFDFVLFTFGAVYLLLYFFVPIKYKLVPTPEIGYSLVLSILYISFFSLAGAARFDDYPVASTFYIAVMVLVFFTKIIFYLKILVKNPNPSTSRSSLANIIFAGLFMIFSLLFLQESISCIDYGDFPLGISFFLIFFALGFFSTIAFIYNIKAYKS